MPLVIRLMAMECSLAALLFGSAGRLDLPWFWALLTLHAAFMARGLRTIDPGLLRERFRPGPGGQDRGLRWRITPFLLAQVIVAGLDAGRFGWSGTVGVIPHVAGLLCFGSGLALATRAMAVNRFFSPVVRIQDERGHHLVSGGPYRYVRHPGYAGMLLSFLGTGLMLGSWWSLVPAAPAVLLILRRTILEDRYLCNHLQGYGDYVRQVRYRLLTWVW